MISICNASGALALEKEAIAKQKVTIEALMDIAGKAVAEEVMKLEPSGLVSIVCGKGNNGGDGFVAARYLSKNNVAVKVITLYKENTFSKEAFRAYERLPEAIIESFDKAQTSLGKSQIIVDAIFGFSFKPTVRKYEASVVDLINKRKAFVVSVDVPSGLEASTGYAQEGKVIEANETVCFSSIKTGLLSGKGPNYAGKIKVADIGISRQIIKRHRTASALDEKEAKKLLPKRKALTHKKAVGRVLVIGGSSDYTGAPVLTCEAALRSGAGFVVIAAPESIKPIIQQKTTEVVVKGFGQESDSKLMLNSLKPLVDLSNDFDCVALGPGLATDKETVKLVISFLRKVKKPVVIDADGLNALAIAGGMSILKDVKTSIVLTPHSGELSRITGLPVEEMENNRLEAAKILASNNVTVILKGRYSVIAAGKELIVNLTSNPGMASAGTGDVLTGIIASFIAQGLGVKQAASLGTYVHGLAGDIAASTLSEYALVATNLIEYLPDAFNMLMTND